MMPGDDPIEVGDLITQMLQDDWQVFSEKVIDRGKEKELLDAIMQSGWEKDSGQDPVDVNALYTRQDTFYRTSPLEKWQEFCEQARRDPEGAPPFSDVWPEELGRLSLTIAAGSTLYRSRKGYKMEEEEIVPYAGSEIGAPPADSVKPGRANRENKRALYCSSEETTCVMEQRPWNGAIISVCQVQLKEDVEVIDLTRTLEAPNPFAGQSLRYELELAELLAGFGDELSTPLTRDDDQTEYFPSQRLSELIEESGFKGLRYRSALSRDGTNLVLFEPELVEILDSKLVRVTGVSVAHEEF
jgi:hypothetical protein